MWEKWIESPGFTKKNKTLFGFEATPENNVDYAISITRSGEKLLEIENLFLMSKDIGKTRSYLLHLAEFIEEHEPKKIRWKVSMNDKSREKLRELYASIADEKQWPGIGFSVTPSLEKGVAYSINQPQVFARVIREKFNKAKK
jgi:hypothetical protein